MNYKDEIDREINEINKNWQDFSEAESNSKNNYADFIKEAIPRFFEEQNRIIEENKKESKITKFFKRLFSIL